MSDPPRRAPSLIILGTDALLAARPATPVQLAHACLALGYEGVVPASWGDELVADAAMRRLLERHEGPAVLCACPNVARRMLQVGAELQPFLVSLVAPPAAAARYLRTLWAPTEIRLTFAGRCAGAADASIDARIAPHELLAIIAERGIALLDQPQVFDEVIPPDRRRYHSLPGGVPEHARLRERCGRELVELRGRELTTELAQYLLTESDVVLDAAAALGCACSGASMCATPREAHLAVGAIEPPRADAPVLATLAAPLPLDLDAPESKKDPIVAEPSVRDAAAEAAARPTTRTVPDDVPVEIVRYTRTGGVIEKTATTSEVDVDDERTVGPRADDEPARAGRPFHMRALARRRASQRPRHPWLAGHDRRQPEAPPRDEPAGPSRPLILEVPESSGMSAASPASDAGAPETTEPATMSELDRLRLTVERALEPFIASAPAAGAAVEEESTERPRRVPPPAPAPADLRVTEIVAPIVVAREPDIVSREPELDRAADRPAEPARDAPSASTPPTPTPTVVEVEPEVVLAGPVRSTPRPPPSLKSIAAMSASTASSQRSRFAGLYTPKSQTRPRQGEAGPFVMPTPQSRRRGRMVASLAIVTLVAASAAVYLGLASRALHALATMAR